MKKIGNYEIYNAKAAAITSGDTAEDLQSGILIWSVMDSGEVDLRFAFGVSASYIESEDDLSDIDDYISSYDDDLATVIFDDPADESTGIFEAIAQIKAEVQERAEAEAEQEDIKWMI